MHFFQPDLSSFPPKDSNLPPAQPFYSPLRYKGLQQVDVIVDRTELSPRLSFIQYRSYRSYRSHHDISSHDLCPSIFSPSIKSSHPAPRSLHDTLRVFSANADTPPSTLHAIHLPTFIRAFLSPIQTKNARLPQSFSPTDWSIRAASAPPNLLTYQTNHPSTRLSQRSISNPNLLIAEDFSWGWLACAVRPPAKGQRSTALLGLENATEQPSAMGATPHSRLAASNKLTLASPWFAALPKGLP